jgi:hypothetical protein
VAEVEDVGAAGEGGDDAAGLGEERLAAGDEERRVEVALDAGGAGALDVLGRPAGVGRGVERDGVGAGGGGEAVVARSGLAREGDDGDAGVAGLEGGDDAAGGLDGLGVERVAREGAGP